MGTAIRNSIIAMAVAIPGFAQADVAFRPANSASVTPFAVQRPQQECWIEHVQVQPARAFSRTVLENPIEAGTTGGAADEHLGSEHWNADAQRACRLQSMPGTARATYDK